MGIIGISQADWAGIESKKGGFSLVPQGKGLLFEITDLREGSYDNKDGEPVEYVTFACTHTADTGERYDHWEFFNLNDKGLPFLKGFIEAIGRQDLFGDEEAEWSALQGTAFTGDIRHRTDKKTGETRSMLVGQTICGVSHEDGQEIDGWQKDVGLERDEEEEAPKKKAKKKVKQPDPEPAEVDDDDDLEDEEEEVEEKPAPKRSKRRSRRGTSED